MLQVVKLVDALESRVVSEVAPAVLYARLQELGEKLTMLEGQLAPNNVKGLKHAVAGICAAADMQAALPAAPSVTASGVSPETLVKAAELAAEHNKGIASLQKHLRVMERDIGIVRAAAEGAEAKRLSGAV